VSIDLTGKSLTFNEAVVAITTEYPFFSDADVRGFFACTNDERALLVQTYKDAGKIPGPSGWEIFLKIMAACVDIANMVIPLTGAIQGVYGVVKLGG
jgi:hypothetical protein